MPRPGLTLRAFAAMAAAAFPPLVLLLLIDLANPNLREQANFALAALGVIAAAATWSAIIAVLFSRVVGAEVRTLVRIAERGETDADASTDSPGADARSRRLTQALDERNRQVAELAAQASAAPISHDPRLVAHHVVEATRSVTGDATWQLAVLDTDNPRALPTGVYGAEPAEAPAEVSDLHRWASVAGEGSRRVRYSTGPWGAFVMVEVAAHEELRAVLMAPWEGRPAPSAAEADLLSLVGQQAATTIEHALLYARVRDQAEELDRMGAVQRDFLRAVSHDLQTPLASIRALAGELRSRPDLDAGSAADLDVIEHQADRLRRMVQQLLAMSRLEAGALQPRQEVLNARPLVERIWAALRAEDRSLQLHTVGPPLLLVADPDRVEQVLWAVLDNAVKYSPPASPIEVTIGPTVSGTPQRAAVAIRDYGAGMDAADLERVFERFYRSEHAQRVAPDGTGIGLFTSRGLVEAMDGSLRLESALGAGTTVTIELPAEPVEEPTRQVLG